MSNTQSYPYNFWVSVHQSVKPGCDNSIRQTLLQDTDFYVCPGHHHGCSLHHKCGDKTDLYCASWGCETSGVAFGILPPPGIILLSPGISHTPQSSLNVNPLCKNSDHVTLGWCLPLSITFTDYAKSKDWVWGFLWGFCLSQSDRDTGLPVTIKFLKEPVYTKLPVPIGPNPILVPQPQPSKKPDPPPFTETAHTFTSETSLAPIANPPPPLRTRAISSP